MDPSLRDESDSIEPEIQELQEESSEAPDIDDEVEELHNSLKEIVQDPSVKPKLQCLMVDPSFSMVTVQSEDSGIVWETASSRCSTPWASEASSTSESYSIEGGTQGKIVIIMDDEKIVRRKKRASSRSKLGERFKRSSSKLSASGSAIGEERLAMIEVSVPNVRSEGDEGDQSLDSKMDKDQELFSLIAEGFEILNIVVPSKLPTVDEEDSSELIDNLSYLENTPKIKSKNTHFESTTVESYPGIVEIDIMELDGVEEQDTVSGNKQTVKDATGDMDYFEKFTLLDAQVPDESPAANEEDEELVSTPTPPEEPPKESTDSLEDGFVIISDIDIAGEHLDEVFYGNSYRIDTDGPTGVSHIDEEEEGKGKELSKPLKESGARLFGSEESILTPIFLSPGPPKIIDLILLEEPTAMSFHYSDLYEDAMGDRKREDELSDAESSISEKSLQRRLSDSDDAEGYLEKFTLRDETPVVENPPDIEETEGKRLIWPQGKFELTGCLIRVTEEPESGEEKTVTEQSEAEERDLETHDNVIHEDIRPDTNEAKEAEVEMIICDDLIPKSEDTAEIHQEEVEDKTGETVAIEEPKTEIASIVPDNVSSEGLTEVLEKAIDSSELHHKVAKEKAEGTLVLEELKSETAAIISEAEDLTEIKLEDVKEKADETVVIEELKGETASFIPDSKSSERVTEVLENAEASTEINHEKLMETTVETEVIDELKGETASIVPDSKSSEDVTEALKKEEASPEINRDELMEKTDETVAAEDIKSPESVADTHEKAEIAVEKNLEEFKETPEATILIEEVKREAPSIIPGCESSQAVTEVLNADSQKECKVEVLDGGQELGKASETDCEKSHLDHEEQPEEQELDKAKGIISDEPSFIQESKSIGGHDEESSRTEETKDASEFPNEKVDSKTTKEDIVSESLKAEEEVEHLLETPAEISQAEGISQGAVVHTEVSEEKLEVLEKVEEIQEKSEDEVEDTTVPAHIHMSEGENEELLNDRQVSEVIDKIQDCGIPVDEIPEVAGIIICPSIEETKHLGEPVILESQTELVMDEATSKDSNEASVQCSKTEMAKQEELPEVVPELKTEIVEGLQESGKLEDTKEVQELVGDKTQDSEKSLKDVESASVVSAEINRTEVGENQEHINDRPVSKEMEEMQDCCVPVQEITEGAEHVKKLGTCESGSHCELAMDNETIECSSELPVQFSESETVKQIEPLEVSPDTNNLTEKLELVSNFKEDTQKTDKIIEVVGQENKKDSHAAVLKGTHTDSKKDSPDAILKDTHTDSKKDSPDAILKDTHTDSTTAYVLAESFKDSSKSSLQPTQDEKNEESELTEDVLKDRLCDATEKALRPTSKTEDATHRKPPSEATNRDKKDESQSTDEAFKDTEVDITDITEGCPGPAEPEDLSVMRMALLVPAEVDMKVERESAGAVLTDTHTNIAEKMTAPEEVVPEEEGDGTDEAMPGQRTHTEDDRLFSPLRSFTPLEDLSGFGRETTEPEFVKIEDFHNVTAEELDYEIVNVQEARRSKAETAEDKAKDVELDEVKGAAQQQHADQSLEAGYEFIGDLDSVQMKEDIQLMEKARYDQDMDSFCLVCHCPFSVKSSGEHENHETCPLDKAYEDIRGKLSEWISVLQERYENVEDLVSELELAYNSVEEQSKSKELAMGEQNEEVLKLVMDQYNEMSLTMEEEKKTKLEKLYDQIVSFQENIDSAKDTMEKADRDLEVADTLALVSSSKDIDTSLNTALESAMSLELGPRGLLVFEDYAKGSSSNDQKHRQAIPVPQKPHLQAQEANSATCTSVTVYWTVNEGDIIDCFQVYCMEEPQGAISEEYRVTVKESYTVLEDLEPDKCYKVWVMAVNYTGCSLPSERLSFRTAPSVPVIQTEDCTVLWDSAILRWSSVHPAAVESYTLEYCRQYACEAEGLRSISGIKGHEHKVFLQPNENYLFYIKSINAAGSSDQSEAALISTRGTRFHLLRDLANSALKVSDDNNSVLYPKENFDQMSADVECPAVLGELLPSVGYHYWETVVAGCRSYRIGVAYPTAPSDSTVGENSSSWCLHCVPTSISCRFELLHDCIQSDIFVTDVPARIGTLLDFRKGRLVFLNAQNGQLLGSFQQGFQQACHPVLALESPGNLDLCMTLEAPEFAKHC